MNEEKGHIFQSSHVFQLAWYLQSDTWAVGTPGRRVVHGEGVGRRSGVYAKGAASASFGWLCECGTVRG